MIQELIEAECQAVRGGQDPAMLDDNFQVRAGATFLDFTSKAPESDSGGS